MGALSAPALLAREAAAEARPRVAVIGHTGRGGFGHGLHTMWLNLPEFELAAVSDPDPAGLAKAMEELGVQQGFRDAIAMLAAIKPDIAVIGMRHADQHRDMVLAAAEAGVQGIYMEKPFCRTPAEADEIVAACDRHGVKLAVAHRNRYHPVLPVLKRLVNDGAIGRLLEFRARGKEDARGGSLDLWVLGSHLLNLIHYLGGEPVACSASVQQDGRPLQAEDIKPGSDGLGLMGGNEVHARFDLESGVPAFFDSVQNAGDPKVGFGLQLIGTEGKINLRADKEPLAYFLPGNPFFPETDGRGWVPISSAGIGKPEPRKELRREVMGHLAGARDLLKAIREDRKPLCSAGDGRMTVEMIAAVFESSRLGGQRVGFPLEQRQNPFAIQAGEI